MPIQLMLGVALRGRRLGPSARQRMFVSSV
jgi:hypothetical protein